MEEGGFRKERVVGFESTGFAVFFARFYHHGQQQAWRLGTIRQIRRIQVEKLNRIEYMLEMIVNWNFDFVLRFLIFFSLGNVLNWNRYVLAIAILSTLYAGGQALRQVHELWTGNRLFQDRHSALLDFFGDQVALGSLLFIFWFILSFEIVIDLVRSGYRLKPKP